MLLELLLQSFDLTAVYTVYATLLLGIAFSALLALKPVPSIANSRCLRINSMPTNVKNAFKNDCELGMKLQLLILKRIKIKIDPGEDAFSFFSK
ncbi:hypothetical protein [Bacillus sp. REN3]|uniref:hypothetical protein n=1 Tax=Bacillus sp. REN3 TaxID=2802440 RepID=UPI001AED8230|nr:hypothetical protein [Bacillus sp. REN3]